MNMPSTPTHASPNRTGTRLSLLAAGLAAAAALAGCASPVPADAPLPALPAQWRFATPASAASAASVAAAGPAMGGTDAISVSWWQAFGSDELAGLVAQARADNPSLAAAWARLRQARAKVAVARAGLFPSLNGSADAARYGGNGLSPDDDTANFRLGLAASYEVDVWGGNRAATASASAAWRAAAFDRDAATLAVTSEVALAWLQAVSLRERTAIAAGMVDNTRRVLALVEARHAAGSATALEVAQQRGLVANRERTMRQLAQRGNDSTVAVAVLLGQPVSNVELRSASLADVRDPSIDSGLPAALLARRPDLAAAEARLVSADADIAMARALMLPRLTLTAGGTFETNRLRALFDNPIYSVAAGVLAPIFDAGRLAAGRDVAIARKQELLADYRSAIIAASADVEMALNTIQGAAGQRIAQDEELAQARRAFTLAEYRYRAGAETLLTVLDAQRTLFDAEDAAAQLRLARLQGSVLLYKALGGGWEPGI
ncbi:efflux transporter outer membrane subunit [Cupriavidus sp. 30B13]|uniref:efflux transporter outer membrane subunit n=1 Tax=Cupriavidus sp. 30B13 TaxID=3384241 RepID=UPI003B8FE7FC